MRTALLGFCLSSMAVLHVVSHVSPVSESFKACLAENEMSRDDFVNALESSDDSEAQCIAACTMEKERFMSGEIVDVDAIIAKMEDVTREIGKPQITSLVTACAAEAQDKKGKCGIAHSVVRCIHDELRKEGWI